MTAAADRSEKSRAADDILEMSRRGFELARLQASYAADMLTGDCAGALGKINDCEAELDRLDRELDEQISATITQIDPGSVRRVLACLKMMIDLERIGDLVANFASRANVLRNQLEAEDRNDLLQMTTTLERMIAEASKAFSEDSLERALWVLRNDLEIDRMRNLLLSRHLHGEGGGYSPQSLHVIVMSQSLERAGDHAKNLAEEICHLLTGHSLRHLLSTKKKPLEQLFLDWLRQGGRAAK